MNSPIGHIEPVVTGEIQRLGLVTDERHDIFLMPEYPVDTLTGIVSHHTHMNGYLDEIDTILRMSPSEKVIRIIEKNIDQSTVAQLTPDQITGLVPFWVQSIVSDPSKKLRLDDPNQVSYPHDPNVILPFTGIHSIDIMLSAFSDRAIYSMLIRNYKEIFQQFLERKDEVIGVLSRGNLAIIANHDMRMNLAIIAHFIHVAWGVKKGGLYTMFGPAITSTEMGYAGLVRHGNSIKTWPSTEKADIGYSKADSVSAGMWRSIIGEFKSKTGRILIIAPSGTTDKYDENTGEFTLKRPPSEVQTLIETRIMGTNKLGMPAMLIGTNAHKISPGNVGLKLKKPAYIRLGEVTTDTKIWTELPQYVVNQHGQQIGKYSI